MYVTRFSGDVENGKGCPTPATSSPHYIGFAAEIFRPHLGRFSLPFAFWFATSRGFVGSQEIVGEPAGGAGRGLLDDEELGKMAVRIKLEHEQRSVVHFPRARTTVFLCCHMHAMKISIRPHPHHHRVASDGVRGHIFLYGLNPGGMMSRLLQAADGYADDAFPPPPPARSFRLSVVEHFCPPSPSLQLCVSLAFFFLLGGVYSLLMSLLETAPPARAADHPETEPLPLRLEGEEEAGRGPCRPHGERPPRGVAAAGGVAPHAAVVPFPSGRRGGADGRRRRRRRRTRNAKVRRGDDKQNVRQRSNLSAICRFWGQSGDGAVEIAAHGLSSRAGGGGYVVARGMNGKEGGGRMIE